MTDQYAVIGNPVAHSKSPYIHACFAEQSRQDLEYGRLLAALDAFSATAREFFAQGGKGLNVTVPFKQEACAFADQCDEQAALAGAVNTLVLQPEGSIKGYTTDGIGLVRDIIRLRGDACLRGQRILVLGAGGATRGILQPLLAQVPGSITIANRTVPKAQELAQLFAPYGRLGACGYGELAGERFDWVINASSSSLQGELPPLPDDILNPDACCYDLMYAKEPTLFCHWAQSHGAAEVADGLGMLVEQAAESFWLWRGVRVDTAAVLKTLRDSYR